MRITVWLFTLLFSVAMKGQQKVLELQPAVGLIPELGEEADRKIARRDSLLMAGDLTNEEMAELDSLLLKYDETIENKWQILGGGCSWYCGEGPYKIKSSSSLGEKYKTDNIHDLSFQYAWVEGAKGNGVGEWVIYYFRNKCPRINEIIIYNGLVKNDEVWKNNGRVKQLRLLVNDKPFAVLHLQDTRAQQSFKVPLLGRRKDGKDLVLKFQVMEVYPGEKYNDLAITEIYFNGIDVH